MRESSKGQMVDKELLIELREFFYNSFRMAKNENYNGGKNYDLDMAVIYYTWFKRLLKIVPYENGKGKI